jgi:hypothetical protein
MRRNLAYAGGALVLSASFLAVALDPKWAFLAAAVLLLIAGWYAAPDSWRARLLPAKWFPPASSEAIQRTLEAKQWGRSRYMFDCRYSEPDETIWLHGRPRDEGGGMWCEVRDPEGIEDHSGTFGGEFHVRYPQEFRGARKRHAVPLAGRYRVRWGAVVSVGDTAIPRQLGTVRFRIPSKL